MIKHSPGPWVTSRIRDDRFEINSDAKPWKAIAVVTANREGAGKVTEKEAECNASLIAAATELLAACEEALECMPDPEYREATVPQREASKMLRVAITKAKGGAA